jgi:hypothetical protein
MHIANRFARRKIAGAEISMGDFLLQIRMQGKHKSLWV